MNLVKLIEFLHSRLKTLAWICGGVLTILFVLDVFVVDKEEAHTAAEHLPGFWSWFGFIGCVAIILISKWFGHAGIMKKEDYYDE